eukprot:COSAG06_NODE_1066_length_10841_cov_14.808806_15_plen_100_part_01
MRLLSRRNAFVNAHCSLAEESGGAERATRRGGRCKCPASEAVRRSGADSTPSIVALTQHALPRDRPLRQSDRPWAPDDGKRDLAQLRALDPMPVLGDAGV